MHNHLLSKNALDVLSSIQDWRIIASGIETGHIDKPDLRHIEWMRTHTSSHQFQEVLFVLSGESPFGYMGTCYPSRPGDVFMMDSFEEHDDHYPPWVPEIEHLWLILLQDKALARIVTKRHGKYEEGRSIIMPENTKARWQHSLFSFKKRPGYTQSVRKLRAYSEMAEVIASVIQVGYSEPDNDLESFQEQIISFVEDHIRDHGGVGVKVDVLAQISGYSRFHLERLFKKRTGKSLRQFINECKVELVMQMDGSGYSKKEIASAMGFSCPSAFSRWYKDNIIKS